MKLDKTLVEMLSRVVELSIHPVMSDLEPLVRKTIERGREARAEKDKRKELAKPISRPLDIAGDTV